MKTGIVADVHHGADADGDVLGLLARIADRFEERDVTTVVLLGDVAVGRTTDDARTNAEAVRDVFDGFDVYATPGNADVREVVEAVFEGPRNGVLGSGNGETTVLVDSAPEATDDATGVIDEAGIELVADRLEAGDSVRILSHYPLQRTEHLPPAFSTHPEIAYPSNKQQFDAALAPHEPGDTTDGGEIAEIVSGHLHPSARLRVRGDPLDVPLTVVEPVVRIERPYRESGRRVCNDRIAVEDLIVEL